MFTVMFQVRAKASVPETFVVGLLNFFLLDINEIKRLQQNFFSHHKKHIFKYFDGDNSKIVVFLLNLARNSIILSHFKFHISSVNSTKLSLSEYPLHVFKMYLTELYTSPC